MAKKAPGFYKKSISKENLEKKYLRFIEHKKDKELIVSAYAYNKEEELYKVREDLEKDDVKKLKLLKKDIKKNRKGPVNFPLLFIVGAIVAGLIFFFTVLINPILGRALETGLEAIFEAKVNVHNFRLSLIRFEVGMSGLEIADRDSPMQNLIQFDRMAIRLRPAAVLRGKVYIEEIRADAIRFATPRRTSGALPGRPAQQRPEREKQDIPPLVDLSNFDPMALLNQEYDKLQTPKLYGEAISAYNDASARWQSQMQASQRRVADLRERSTNILNINMNDYRTLDPQTIELLRTNISDANALINSAQEAGNEITSMVNAVQEDLNTAMQLEQNARDAFAGDMAYLRSFLDLSGGPALDILESIIWDILTDSAHEYLVYAQRAVEIMEKVNELQARLPKSSKPEKVPYEKFKGRDVIFPVVQYPRFFLALMSSDVYTPNEWHWDFDLRGVSSDPDLSNIPISLRLSMDETAGINRSAAFNGMADLRTNARELFNMDVSGRGFPISLGSIEQAGIGGFAGNTAFELDVSGFALDGFIGNGSISIHNSRIMNPGNTLIQAVDSALERVNSLDIGLGFERTSAANSFSISTNIGDIILQALRDMAAVYLRRAEQELERFLRERISSFIDDSLLGREELDAIFLAVRGDRAAMDQLNTSLVNKRNEFEQRLRSAGESAARDALSDRLSGDTPALPSLPGGTTPSLPGGLFGR